VSGVTLIASVNTLGNGMQKIRRPIGVDLFCGVGGMTLGFEEAGFDVLAAVDVEPIHVETYRKNFPNCSTWCADLSEVCGDDIRKESGLGSRTVEVAFAGTPCQGFSLIGKRRRDDPRNLLLVELGRLIGELSPLYFVVENVEGIRTGNAKMVLDKFVTCVSKVGYCVVEPIKVLDAAQFGVPQRRRRVFVLGYRKGLHAPEYPEPIYLVDGHEGHDGPTVWDAISDLPSIGNYKYLLSSDEYRGKLGEPSAYAKVLRGEALDPEDLSYKRQRNAKALTGCMRTVHTRKTIERFGTTPQGTYEKVSRFHRLSMNGLANTLRAGTGPAQGSFMAPRPIHPFQNRCITVREAARIHSFPDWFVFHSTKWHSFRQIGNSVPPRLARAVAQSVRQALEDD
jgi:DNA (cytosine-5)-methyltransferase 1